MAFVRHRRQKKKTAAELLHKKPGQMGPPHLHSNDVKKNTGDKNTTLILFFFIWKEKGTEEHLDACHDGNYVCALFNDKFL